MPISVKEMQNMMKKVVIEMLGVDICPLNPHGKVDVAYLNNALDVMEMRRNLRIDKVINIKNEYRGTDDPTPQANMSSGFEIGSRWINTHSNKEFVCTGMDNEAAIWKETTQTANLFGTSVNSHNMRTNTFGSTTSITYKIIPNIGIRPVPGTYYVVFSGTLICTAHGQTGYCVLENGGTIMMDTEREVSFQDDTTTALKTCIHTQTILIVDGTTTVNALFKSSDTNPLLMQNYSLALIKLG